MKSNDKEWIFDLIWELSDKAHDAGLMAVSTKLEEAMDTYLGETRADHVSPAEFEQRRQSISYDSIDPLSQVNPRWVRRLADQEWGGDQSLMKHARKRAGSGFPSNRLGSRVRIDLAK